MWTYERDLTDLECDSITGSRVYSYEYQAAKMREIL